MTENGTNGTTAPEPHRIVIGDGGLEVRGYCGSAALTLTDGKLTVRFAGPKDPTGETQTLATLTTDAKVARAKRAVLGKDRLQVPVTAKERERIMSAAMAGSLTLTGEDALAVLAHIGIAEDADPKDATKDPRWIAFVASLTAGTKDGLGFVLTLPRTAEGFTVADASVAARLASFVA